MRFSLQCVLSSVFDTLVSLVSLVPLYLSYFLLTLLCPSQIWQSANLEYCMFPNLISLSLFNFLYDFTHKSLGCLIFFSVHGRGREACRDTDLNTETNSTD
jgi:hypothetical protein